MKANKDFGIIDYVHLPEHISTLLNTSLTEIKREYGSCPYVFVEHFDGHTHKKSIEIRFDDEEFSLICTLDSNEICKFVLLDLDDSKTGEQLLKLLQRLYDYDSLRNRWAAATYYVKVKEPKKKFNKRYFIFYTKDTSIRSAHYPIGW